MKKIIQYTILLAIASSAASCKKFLDKEPDNRTHITTPDQLSQLLTSGLSTSQLCYVLRGHVRQRRGQERRRHRGC